MNVTAEIAMPTPNSTPAIMRLESPSPNAKVRPAITIETSERPLAIGPVKALIKTSTAFSHGDCAKAGTAKIDAATVAAKKRRNVGVETNLGREIDIGSFSGRPLKSRPSLLYA